MRKNIRTGKMENNKALIIFMIIIFVIGFGTGYAKGVSDTIRWSVKVAFKLIEIKKINISIDEEMISAGIGQYQGRINDCLFNNASGGCFFLN